MFMDRSRVFVDTSVFVAAILSSTGGSYYILSNFKDKVKFQTSRYVLEEIDHVLDSKFLNQSGLRNKLFLLLSVADIAILQNPSRYLLNALSEVISNKDSPILAGALKDSDILLTLDNEFFGKKITELARKKNLNILKPKDFIELLKQE
ncbi:putative toxin-antitoxin system toxin component, PIN family [Candidatus Giovannonibacteria bacterium RIFCSPHIGHO2_02_FULL_44_11]|nr:MAG: putative toxin-antitoxin system toxin component, PIN family [Candidatus Giovannonibacteria bacterium RIFCSPHIGHO2_02_FULL_44_11]